MEQQFKFIHCFEAPGPDGELEEREGYLVFSVGDDSSPSTDECGNPTEITPNHGPTFEYWMCLHTDEIITDEKQIGGDWTARVKYDDPA